MGSKATNSEHKTAVVLSGGGARGAYEAGVLGYMFEKIYPDLGDDFEVDITSGTSVGAIHASYLAASHHLAPRPRARRLEETWTDMAFEDIFRASAVDILRVPLRAMGLLRRRDPMLGPGVDTFGGVLDVSPVKRLVSERIPWSGLRRNLDARTPGALCIACTNVRSGQVTVFMDGPSVETSAWDGDSQAIAIHGPVDEHHVRASAAIPFLFPSVRIDDRYYIDGGLRSNTPLSPAVRLRANKILVVALRQSTSHIDLTVVDETAVTQPTFLLGKLLNMLMMDQLEQELRQLDLVNKMLEGVSDAFGEHSIEKINATMREARGMGYRHIDRLVLRPSADIGEVAAYCQTGECLSPRSQGLLGSLFTRAASFGSPRHEADLLSYLFFDSSFTRPLVELGREDAEKNENAIFDLLAA